MPAAPRHVHVILNAGAACFLRQPVREICRRIADEFDVHGISAEIFLGFGSALVRRAKEVVAAGAAGAIIAGGGDGTVGSLAAVVADTAIPLGVLPLGRFNHFARDLGIPPALDLAIGIIAAGHVARVDSGEVNGHLFVNNSSLGAYPFMVLDREKLRWRRGLALPLAWGIVVWKLLRNFPLRRFSVRTAGRAEIWRTPCLFIGNNRYELQLVPLGRRPGINAGELWVYIARQQTRTSLIWFMLRLLIDLRRATTGLHVFPCAAVEIGSRAPWIAVALDGEVVRMRPPLRYRIRPGSLCVYAPVSSELSRDAVDRPHIGPAFRAP